MSGESLVNNPKMIEMMKLIDKDFIIATINMFKDVKENAT